jgi:hypothetical protein
MFAKTCQILANTYQIHAKACHMIANTYQISARACQMIAKACQLHPIICQMVARHCQMIAKTCQICARAFKIPSRLSKIHSRTLRSAEFAIPPYILTFHTPSLTRGTIIKQFPVACKIVDQCGSGYIAAIPYPTFRASYREGRNTLIFHLPIC